MTAVQVQLIAMLVKIDLDTPNLDRDLLDDLSRIAANGSNSKNTLRDLTRTLPENPMPPLREHWIPIDHPTLGKSSCQFPFIDPHELFSTLFHEYPQCFFKHVVPSIGALEDFWDSVSGLRGFLL